MGVRAAGQAPELALQLGFAAVTAALVRPVPACAVAVSSRWSAAASERWRAVDAGGRSGASGGMVAVSGGAETVGSG